MDTENQRKVMDSITKRSLEVLQAALVLGILGDALLRATPWGLNVFLWGTLFVVGFWAIILRNRENGMSIGTMSLCGALVFFSAMFVWRDAEQLMVLDVAAIIMVLAVLALPVLQLKMEKSGLFHYAIGWAYSAINVVVSPLLLVFDDIKWDSIFKFKGTGSLGAVIRGLLIAVPVLLIFGGLFMSADAAFQELVQNTFRIDLEEVLSHVLLTGVFFWVTAGYFRGSSLFMFRARVKKENPLSISPETEAAAERKAEGSQFDLQDINNSILPQSFTLGAIELGLVLGLMNLLFLSFVIVQLPYLFGGMDLVQNTENFKLSEYARRGFGELVMVSVLVLPLLLAAHWLVRKEDKLGQKIYKALAGTQVILLFVIMASAAQRMFLYTGNSGYGLTTARFYPMVFMLLLAIVFGWFGATVLTGRRQHFAWGALWSALVLLGVLHVFNPDDFIARTNFRLMREGRNFDTRYLKTLSDDAVPALIEETPSLTLQEKCAVQRDLNFRFAQSEKEADLRAWNWSRANARAMLAQAGYQKDLSFCNETPPNR